MKLEEEMKTRKQKFIGFSLLVVFALILSACGGSSKEPTPTPVDPNLIAAQAIATFSMGLTQTAFAQPTIAPTSTPFPTNTLAATFAVLGTNTPGVAPTSSCYVGEFVTDVNYPDGSLMAPGQQFDKIWRIKNIGTCDWLPTFVVVYSYGAGQMASVATPLGKTVKPGDTIDITVEMTAPTAPGNYVSAWFIKADNGELFRKMTIDIKVVGAVGPTATPTETPTATP